VAMEQQELEYLKALCQKYGSQYLHKYFGFSLAEIAQKTGVKPNLMSMIIKGQRKLQPKAAAKFALVFKEMRIEERTKDFKEPPAQLLIKQIVRNLKKS